MSLTALRNAFKHIETVPMAVPARLVLLALANHHNQETGRCDPSINRLSTTTQLSARAVQLGLRDLEKMKLIYTVERQARTGKGKRNLTNRYRIKGGEQYAATPLNNMHPKQEQYYPSAFDDLAMMIETLGDDDA